MAELKTAKAPTKIATLGLGSCIGICIYDAVAKVGGMVHIMLPNSEIASGTVNIAKFADTAIPSLLQEVESLGAVRKRLVTKIAGGAQMFSIAGSQTNNSLMNIGAKNITAVTEICSKLGLAINASCVGGNVGRSITLNLENGDLDIRTAKGTNSII
jgi:chemotaxis protein CheD